MERPHLRLKGQLWRRSLAAASILWLGLGMMPTPVPLAVTEASAAQRKQAAAYVFDKSGLTFYDRDADKLDQLIYSFALIKDGAVTGSHWRAIEAYKAFIDQHPHILPVVAIGGWGADGFSQAVSTAEGRSRFVQSTLQLMDKHGFLGVDIDWEYPGSSVAGIASSPKDGENLILLLQELRSALDELTAKDGRKRILSIALGAAADQTKRIDAKAIGQVVDQVNLMTYDLHQNRVASHHTALYGDTASADEAVRLFAQAGIPKCKMMLGVAFYGRVYTLANASANPVVSAKAVDSGSKSLPYTRLLEKLKSAAIDFDENAKAAFATDGATFYTYDSPASIQHKGAYVRQNGLLGMMCWEYGGDSSGELLSAMRTGLDTPSVP